jgi:hypothetical protein
VKSIIVFIFSCALLFGSDEGFAGKWVLDKGSPRPGDAPNDYETKIKQKQAELSFETTFKEPDNGIVPILYLGLMTSSLRLNTEGTETQNKVGPFQMATKTTMTSPRQMDTDWKGVVNEDAVEGHWCHKISDDGKHMTVEIKERSGKGESVTTLYFVRK